jgi:homoserine acetyltransferase
MHSLHESPQVSRELRRLSLPALPLESGNELRAATIAYHLDGAISPQRDNVILLLHALTGSADAAGDWWREQIGPGRAIDTTRWAVLAPNLLGSCYGSSGPASAVEPFPTLTVGDVSWARSAGGGVRSTRATWRWRGGLVCGATSRVGDGR